jgi:hypothetical protein
MTGISSIVLFGGTDKPAEAPLTGTVSIVAVGFNTQEGVGEAVLSGTSSIAAEYVIPGAVNLLGETSMGVDELLRKIGESSLSVSSSLVAFGDDKYFGEAVLTSSATLNAVNGLSVTASLACSGTMVSNSEKTVLGSINMASSATFVVDETVNKPAEATLTVSSSLTSDETYTRPPFYDVANGTVTHDGSFDLSLQSPLPYGVAFNDTGTKMYVPSAAYPMILQYALTAPYDVTGTVVYEGPYYTSYLSLHVSFNPTGTKMYSVDYQNNTVRQYSLTTVFDVTGTVTFDGLYSIMLSTGDDGDRGIFTFRFNDDGTKMYLLGLAAVGVSDSKIYQYSLSTPYDVTSTVTSEGDSGVLSPAGVWDFVFNDDGTRFYTAVDFVQDKIEQYSLSTPYDVTSTVTYEGSFNVSAEESQLKGLAFNDVGTKVYTVGTHYAEVNQYTIS